jgi:hypothetical protein
MGKERGKVNPERVRQRFSREFKLVINKWGQTPLIALVCRVRARTLQESGNSKRQDRPPLYSTASNPSNCGGPR